MSLPRVLFAALAVVTMSSTARAQAAAYTPVTEPSPVTAVETAGPRREAARVGVVIAPTVASERAAPAPMYKKANVRGRNLMIIGGAAILGGAIVGGDAGGLVSLGGLGVGLYGLYIYLN